MVLLLLKRCWYSSDNYSFKIIHFKGQKNSWLELIRCFTMCTTQVWAQQTLPPHTHMHITRSLGSVVFYNTQLNIPTSAWLPPPPTLPLSEKVKPCWWHEKKLELKSSWIPVTPLIPNLGVFWEEVTSQYMKYFTSL